VVECTEGNIVAPRDGHGPDGLARDPTGVREQGMQGRVPQEPGRSRRLHGSVEPPSGAQASEAGASGRRGVGVPQVERGRGGTFLWEPAEERAAPDHGLVRGKEDEDTELRHPLHETRTNGNVGSEPMTGGAGCERSARPDLWGPGRATAPAYPTTSYPTWTPFARPIPTCRFAALLKVVTRADTMLDLVFGRMVEPPPFDLDSVTHAGKRQPRSLGGTQEIST
jgi:hypothetical protein